MGGKIDAGDVGYADKLAKLLPAEGIAALSAVKTYAGENSSSYTLIEIAVPVVGVFVVVWALRVRQVELGLQFAFIMLAYALWSIMIFWKPLHAGIGWVSELPNELPIVLALLFSLFIPIIFPNPR